MSRLAVNAAADLMPGVNCCSDPSLIPARVAGSSRFSVPGQRVFGACRRSFRHFRIFQATGRPNSASKTKTTRINRGDRVLPLAWEPSEGTFSIRRLTLGVFGHFRGVNRFGTFCCREITNSRMIAVNFASCRLRVISHQRNRDQREV